MWATSTYSDLKIQPKDDPARDSQRLIFREMFYFRRYRDHCITIWKRDVDKIDFLLDF